MGTLIEIYICGCMICAVYGLWKMYDERVKTNGMYMPSKKDMNDWLTLTVMSWYGIYLILKGKKE